MRRINKRESFLLILFLAAGLGMGCVFGARWFGAQVAEHRQRLAMERNTLEELRRWVAEKDQWTSIDLWLRDNPPPAYDGEQSESEFVEETQRKLAQAGIQILDQRLLETITEGDLAEVGVELVISAPLEPLLRWLHSTQQPGAFREIRGMQLKSDADNLTIRSELTLVQYFQRENFP